MMCLARMLLATRLPLRRPCLTSDNAFYVKHTGDSPHHHFIYTSAESRRLCWVSLRPERWTRVHSDRNLRFGDNA